MPERQTAAILVKKPRPEVLALSGLLAITGVGIILLWASQRGKTGYGDMKQIGPDELMSLPISPSLEGAGAIPVRVGQAIPALRPSVMYIGPGRDTFTYFRVVQIQGGQELTVQGSGIAGVHVSPAAEATVFDLVSPDQVEPAGCPQQALCAYAWPGPVACPISGAPPQMGYADALLEIYQKDALSPDGFGSPTYLGRLPIIAKRYRNKVLYSV